jgi:hypothetical protein
VGAVTKPRLLDLFSGAGGAARGYQRAGFHVTGVDIRPQPHYAGDVFIEADAMTYPLDGFDVIHASPPCQPFTRASHLRTAQGGRLSALDLLEPTRQRLIAAGVPWVIENVEGAPMAGVRVCGSALGLGVRRHRLFESSELVFGTDCRHREQGRPIGVYYRPGDEIPKGGKTAVDLAEGQRAMGIDWMTWNELKEAVPPTFTEWIGRQLMAVVGERAA